MRALRTLLALVAVLLAFSASAQKVQLQGRILDDKGQPIELVNVVVVSHATPLGATTDAKGRFSLSVPQNRKHTLRCSCLGYASLDTVIEVLTSPITLNFTLKTSATTMRAVNVTDEKNRTTTFTKIDAERLENVTGPAGGVEALLKTLPDVSSNNELSSQYSVRGGSFDENLVYINDVEIYRPQLVRNGQQEGMSIINSDLVDNILFSPGGFDATYGDKMSSVLDLDYSKPVDFKGKASVSFLGASASLQGTLGKERRFSYSAGFRQHSNRYIFGSLDTEGQYRTSYTDFQSILGYRLSDNLDIQLLAILSRNVYRLVPEHRTTTFGTMQESLQLDVYFDGQEMDRYYTQLGALTFDYHPNDEFRIKWITSAQHINENEIYDIQSQYWLYQLGMGETVGEFERFDMGYGTYLEHARNYLSTSIFSTEVKGTRHVALGDWKFGAKWQHEQIDDRILEWKWVDSAGYTLPMSFDLPGVAGNVPHNPQLQNYCHTTNALVTDRLIGYAQRSLTLLTRHDDKIFITAGLRAQGYKVAAMLGNNPQLKGTLSPRLSVNLKPHQNEDILFRLAAGIYQQAPFYREYRHDDGSLNLDLKAQTSYQVMATTDWNLHIREIPVHLTADLFYKYITDLVPFRVENLRTRYDANNDAVAYATGLSLRMSGELVEGLESWASLSIMKTQEDLLGDDLGWLDRPTDQRISFKMFLQDRVPRYPFWRMSLSFIVGDGLPTLRPNAASRDMLSRLPAYYRIDWGNTLQLSHVDRLKDSRLFQKVDDMLLSFEIFNLFNYHNVVSYLWVADYSNYYYPVPEYLTARQLNLKITVLF